MKFFCKAWKAPLPDSIEYPCVVLETNNWNDYGYYTTFNFSYYNEDGTSAFWLKAGIKIFQRDKTATEIPEYFAKLDYNYCSLGQSLEFYSNLYSLGRSIYQEILVALRDTVYGTDVDKSLLGYHGFYNSLLRFSEAEKAYKEAAEIFPELNKEKSKKDKFSFNFRCRVEGAENDHVIDFDFSAEKTGLFRITALIGKNGTGKTQVLANFARSMSGLDRAAKAFSPNRPSFSKVISISYSAFDQFSRPTDEIEVQIKAVQGKRDSKSIDQMQELDEQRVRLTKESDLFSYVYCGLRRDHNRLLKADEMMVKLKTAFSQVKKLQRLDDWREVLKPLFDDQLSNSDSGNWLYNGSISRTSYNQLSSGQRILLLVLTDVVANIESESIILYDEPELHLHPEAISDLARALHILLNKFNSYGIIATHSPILLQEIPSKHVRIFRRQGNYVHIDTLEIESFGENLTVIIDEVFDTVGLHNNYKDHLKVLLKEYSQQQILGFFDNRLGFNARAALSALEKSLKNGQ